MLLLIDLCEVGYNMSSLSFIHLKNPKHHTLNSVTGSGHVKYQENPSACKLHGDLAWKIYLLLSLMSQLYIWMSSGHVLTQWKLSCIINDDHIFLSFGMYLPGQSSCHLYMTFQLLQNQASGHIKVKKGTGHVFYKATPSHTNESAVEPKIWLQLRQEVQTI